MHDESGDAQAVAGARPREPGGVARRWLDASEHAALIHEAREAAGLSQRALASRMGVSWVTVRQAEMGRDLRHATLQRFLSALPTLTAGALLRGRPHGVPPSRAGAWLALRDLVGFASRRVSRTVVVLPDGARCETSRVTGLQSEREHAGETTRRDLMMAACEGSGSALPLVLVAAGDPRPATLNFSVGDMKHSFRLVPAAGREGIDYRCRRRSDAHAGGIPSVLEPADALRMGLVVKATHPTLRMSLRLRLPRGLRPAAPSVVAWPEALLPGERDLADQHHGGALPLSLRREGSDLCFDVEQPLPGTCYAACWDGLTDDGRRVSFAVGGKAPRRLADVLRGARESAGLSRRALASRMGAAEVLVRTAEQGRDVRRSTLGLYLDALPQRRPTDLLRAGDAAHSMTREELDRHWLDFFGCEAAVEHKIMTVRPNGDCEIVHVVRGLRTLPGRARALRLLDSQQPSYYAHEPPRCRRVDVPQGDAEGIRTRLHARPDGRVVQEVALPASLAEQGAAFRREIIRSGVFHLTAERARALRGVDEGPVQDGAMLYSLFPARRRILEVRFPEGYWPRRVVAQAWPTAAPPYPEVHEVGARLHPKGFKPALSRAASRVTLKIDAPQVGFKYALVWDLP